MANKYLRSTDGSDADDGSTWALAKAKIAAAITASASGDQIIVSQVHAETTGAAVTITMPGSITAPFRIACGNDAAEPPTADATTASIKTTGGSDISIKASGDIFGILFECGDASNFANMNINTGTSPTTNMQRYKDCLFRMSGAHPSAIFSIGSIGTSSITKTTFANSTFKFSSTSQYVGLGGTVEINGGGIESGGSTPVALFKAGGSGYSTNAVISGFDFSALAATVHLIKTPSNSQGKIVLRDCKLPASWSGNLVQAAYSIPDNRFEMWNCDSGNTNYKFWIEDWVGTIKQEATVIMTGGASDGVTGYAMKMASNANASGRGGELVSPEIIQRVDTVGSSKTATLEILHDSTTNLTDDEVWIELSYLGTSGFPVDTVITDRKAGPFATAADQTASSATWTTTGLTNPNKQKLQVTFTPQVKGYVRARVFLAKASKTVYVDPKLTVA